MRELGENLSEENALCKLKRLSCPFFFSLSHHIQTILSVYTAAQSRNLVLEYAPTQRHSTIT